MNRSNSSHRSFSADELRAALGDVGGPARPDYVPDIVEQAGRMRQRPAWTFLESWVPMDIAVRRRGVPRALVVFATVSLLIALLAAGVVYVGSQMTQPKRPPGLPLGMFEPVAGRILSGLWDVDPIAVDPNAPSSSTQLRLGSTSVLPLGWSSDGTDLLFMRKDPADQSFPPDTHIFILHEDGTETQVRREPVGGAAISPDGSRVAYAADGLYIVDTEGGQPVRIAQEGNSPTFSADGLQIAYLSKPRDGCCVQAGREHVWVANANGTEAHEILADEPALADGVFTLTWSPAGDRIAIGNSGGDLAIYTFAPDGSDFTKVISGGMNPFWSPDGSQIAYMRPYDGPFAGLAIADADGSNVREFGFAASGPWHPGMPTHVP